MGVIPTDSHDSSDSKSEAYSSLLGSRSHQFAIKASEWALANDSPEFGWEKAHTPLPQGLGDEWVWLPHDLHQIHGLLQSEDLQRTCFLCGSTKAFLRKNFCSGWFELWDLYDRWTGDQISDFWFVVHPDYHWEVVKSLRKFAFAHGIHPQPIVNATKRGSSHKGFKAYKLPTPTHVPDDYKLSFT